MKFPHFSLILLSITTLQPLFGQEISNLDQNNAPPCVDEFNKPLMCYPPFTSAAYLRNVDVTNTCGMTENQKYCVDLSNIDMAKRCQFCNNNNQFLRHPAKYLTDESEQTWWQSETLAANKSIHNKISVNLTLHLGTQFYVTYMYLKFKSPRPAAMVIYKKFNDSSHWTPWQYFSVNCWTYFRMKSMDNFYMLREPDKPYCTERYSAMNPYYDGDVIFSTIKGIPSSTDFFENQKLQDWTTASQIRIELKKMHTFGDESHAEKQTLFNYYFGIRKFTVGARCLCNGHGNRCLQISEDGEIQCQCHLLHYTKGNNCERCMDGYNDRPWAPASKSNPNPCKACNCNGNSKKCVFDMNIYRLSNYTTGGRCLDCQNNTEGINCEKCKITFAPDKLNPKVCVPCNCNPIGSTNRFCDKNGQCSCKSGVGGLKCDICLSGYYGFSDVGCRSCQCNYDGTQDKNTICDSVSGQCHCKQNVVGKLCNRCMEGFFALSADNVLGCRSCFCFKKTNQCTSADNYEIYNITSDFIDSDDGWRLFEDNFELTEKPLWNREDSFVTLRYFDLNRHEEHLQAVFYLDAPGKFVHDIRNSYDQYLVLEVSFIGGSSSDDNMVQTYKDDVAIINHNARLNITFSFSKMNNSPPSPGLQKSTYLFKLTETSPHLTSPPIPGQLFIALLSGVSNIKIRLNYPNAILRLHRVTLMSARLVPFARTNNRLDSIERCKCPPAYTGDSCQECAHGYRRLVPNSGPFGVCIPCSCNSNGDICDPETGKCRCRNYSSGDNCESCLTGYYKSLTSQCVKCPCPINTNCTLYKVGDRTQAVCIDCPDNRDGMLCMTCKDNYYGNPSAGIRCKPCDCNNNIDYNNLDNCDSITGVCQRCIYNTYGDHCENCMPGYYGNARNNPVADCRPCGCNVYGTVLNSDGIRTCDLSGKCECKHLVQGQKCDQCFENHYGLKSGEGCKECSCDKIGSLDMQCAESDGTCKCKLGVTGKFCDRCMTGYFNLTDQGCQPCYCDYNGSLNSTCDDNGQCICRSNVIGLKCNICRENHHNISANCPECPPCYSLVRKKFNELYKLMESFRNLLQLAITDQFSPINQEQVTQDLIKLQREISTLESKAKVPNVGSTGVDPMMLNNLKDLLENCRQLVLQINSKMDYTINSQPINSEFRFLADNVTALNIKISSNLDSFSNNMPKILQDVRQAISSIGQYDKEMKTSSSTAMEIIKGLKMNAKRIETELNKIERWISTVESNITNLKPILSSGTISTSRVKKMVDDFVAEVENVAYSSDNIDKITTKINKEAKMIYQKAQELRVPDLIQELRDLILRLQKTKSDSEKLLRNMRDSYKRMDVSDLKNSLNQLEQKYNKEKETVEDVKSAFRTLTLYNDKINQAEKLFNEAMTLAKQIYEDLQNFESKIARTKPEAIREWKKMIRIESDLVQLESKIISKGNRVTNAKNSALDAVTDVDMTSSAIFRQFDELKQTKTKSKEASESIEKEKQFAENIGADFQKIKSNAQVAKYDFERNKDVLNGAISDSDSINGQLKKQRKQAEKVLNNLRTINDTLNNLNELDKETEKKLRNQIDNILKSINDAQFDAQHDMVIKHYNEAQAQFKEIKELHKQYQMEIANLKNINSFMYDGEKNGCFKIGATVEGKI